MNNISLGYTQNFLLIYTKFVVDIYKISCEYTKDFLWIYTTFLREMQHISRKESVRIERHQRAGLWVCAGARWRGVFLCVSESVHYRTGGKRERICRQAVEDSLARWDSVRSQELKCEHSTQYFTEVVHCKNAHRNVVDLQKMSPSVFTEYCYK